MPGTHRFINATCPTCNVSFKTWACKPNRCCSLKCGKTGKLNHNYIDGRRNNPALKHRIERLKFPMKVKARELVSSAIKTKRLLKKPCSVCGDKIVHAHHEDYSKPLDVIWLCRNHHLELHKHKKALTQLCDQWKKDGL